MYCEAERAKLTRMLSAPKERQGDVASAADILQDVNVETRVFGVRGEILDRRRAPVAASAACARGKASHAPHATGTPSPRDVAAMAYRTSHVARGRVASTARAIDAITHIKRRYGALSKREKVDYILDQVRLMLAKGDRVRAYILSKSPAKDPEDYHLQDLKVRFYKLMSEYHVLEDAPFDLAQNSGPYLTRRRSRTTRRRGATRSRRRRCSWLSVNMRRASRT